MGDDLKAGHRRDAGDDGARVRPALDRMHLVVVREVDRLGSLTAAADALALTQSALSHSMRKLERQIGVDLWLRDGRNLRLTPAGRDVLALAHRLLPQFERAEQRLREFARGERGLLRIGMECHPCYRWLLGRVAPYLSAWPEVDVDVRQRFQFGGIAALLADEIDLLVTPDPVHVPGLRFEAVFDYEQVLVVPRNHPLAGAAHVRPAQLAGEVLISYPVETDRLDIFSLFLRPAGVRPRAHRTIETTDILLQMVASGRGVAALPLWLVRESQATFDVAPVRLGRSGIAKSIHLGVREADLDVAHVGAFIESSRGTRPVRTRARSPRRSKH